MKKFLSAIFILLNAFAKAQPQVAFSADSTQGCAPLTVHFTNMSSGVVSYQWDFDDGNTSSLVNPVHTYPFSGYYLVSLNGYDANMNYLGSYNVFIEVYDNTGDFYTSADSVCPNEQVPFYASFSSSPYYNWNFGDGSTGYGPYIEHYYSSEGTYTVTLVYENPCGTITATKDITVSNSAFPDADFYFSNNTVCPNDVVNFSSNGNGTNSWDFGNGQTSTSPYASTTYSDTGIYTITHSVTNICGNTSTVTQTINVVSDKPIPWASMSANPQITCTGNPVSFYTSYGYLSYQWDFGDGTPISDTNIFYIKHTYNTNGNYSASVTITNGCGNDTTLYTDIEISNSPYFNSPAGINFHDSVCPNSPAEFYGWSGGNATSYLWNFGDGGTDTNQWTTHFYNQTGTYTVSLKLTNYCGNDTTVFANIVVSNNIVPNPMDYDFGPYPLQSCPNAPVLFYFYPPGQGTYLWNFGDGTSTTNAPYDSLIGTDAAYHSYGLVGNYNGFLIFTNTCGNSFTNSFTINIGNNIPVQGGFWYNGDAGYCQNDTVEFMADGGTSYTWNFGDGTNPLTISSTGFITLVQHSYSVSGNYAVSVTVNNSCGNSQTYTDNIIIDSCALKINEFTNSEIGFEIYPNPTSGNFNVIISQSDNVITEKTEMNIYNLLGEVIYYSLIHSSNQSFINLSKEPKGIYFLKISDGEKVFTGKIIIQ